MLNVSDDLTVLPRAARELKSVVVAAEAAGHIVRNIKLHKRLYGMKGKPFFARFRTYCRRYSSEDAAVEPSGFGQNGGLCSPVLLG